MSERMFMTLTIGETEESGQAASLRNYFERE